MISQPQVDQLLRERDEARAWAWALEHRHLDHTAMELELDTNGEVIQPAWLETSVPPWEAHLLFRVPDGHLDAHEHVLRGKGAGTLLVGEHVHLTDVDTDHPVGEHWGYARVVEVGDGWARAATVRGLVG